MGGDDVLALLNVGGVNNGLAFLARDLARVLLWGLVALPVLLVMALGSSGIALAGFSFSFGLTLSNSVSTITTISMGNNLGIMSNNCGAVLNLLGCFLTMSRDDVLTLFNIGSVYDNIIFLMALLTAGLLWCFVALPVLLIVALRSTGVTLAWLSLCLALGRGDSTIGKAGGQDENKKLHFEFRREYFPP